MALYKGTIDSRPMRWHVIKNSTHEAVYVFVWQFGIVVNPGGTMQIQFEQYIQSSFDELSTLCNKHIERPGGEKPLRIVLEPKDDQGKENLYISVYDDNITINYDYYETFKKQRDQTVEDFFGSIIGLITEIVKEQLIVVTTYHKLHTFPVSNLMPPAKSKKIARKENFRSRSFQGTYDDDYPHS